MKKILLVIAFVLISGLIMANDWRVISDVKYMVLEFIGVGNIKTGEYFVIKFNQDDIEFPYGLRKTLGFDLSNNDVKEHKLTKEELTENALITKKICEIWEAIGDYQKHKK